MKLNHQSYFLIWLIAILLCVFSCEEPEAPIDVPETPTDTIITPTDTITNPPVPPGDTTVVDPPVDAPVASFTFTNNFCTAICSLAFTNTSIHATTYKWDFGDGSNPSIDVSPYHYYETSGTYRVILTASNSDQSDRDTQMVEIRRPVIPYAIGTSKNEFGTGVVQTSDGGYVVAGSKVVEDGSTDLYLLKTDASRNVVWQKVFGGTADQAANAIRQTSDGGYIIVGNTNSEGGGMNDIYLVRTDAEGNLIWEKTFSNNGNDTGEDVTPINEGGFLITGVVKVPHPDYEFDYDLILLKTDMQGNMIWEKRLGTSYHDGGYAVQQTSDGNFVVAGYYDLHSNYAYPYLIKIDGQGTVIWEQHTIPDLVYVYSVQQTLDGGFIWAGLDSGGFSPGSAHGVMVKTDMNGVVTWNKKFSDPGVLFNNIEYVQQTSDGGYILSGRLDDSGYDFPPRRLVMVIKTDAAGNETWVKSYGAGGKVGTGFQVQQTSDGGYIIVGHMLIEPSHYLSTEMYLNATKNYDIYLLKINQNGTPE